MWMNKFMIVSLSKSLFTWFVVVGKKTNPSAAVFATVNNFNYVRKYHTKHLWYDCIIQCSHYVGMFLLSLRLRGL